MLPGAPPRHDRSGPTSGQPGQLPGGAPRVPGPLLARTDVFGPLRAAGRLGGGRGRVKFFRDHPMAETYGPLARQGQSCLALRDARGTILSLPPVLNGRAAVRGPGGGPRAPDRGDRHPGTQRCRSGRALTLVVFVAQGWSAASCPGGLPGPRALGRSVAG